ncbi:MAG: phospholipase D family protein [Gammaproteobacteria bacterium]|nr:phospholipase D family protein [Gammaproteobacteria bacterium]
MIRLALTVIVALGVLGGCSLSEKRISDVDRVVSDHRETRLDCAPANESNCAIASPLLEQARMDDRADRHRVTLVEFGEDALVLRIHLIRAARERVDLQNFILRKDMTGELVLNELLDAARRGVKVRLLLDQMFTFSDAEYLVWLTMTHANLEVRFYNPSFDKAKMAKHDWLTGIACCFRRVNQRMHNKLLVVDELVGVTGGRNVADRYYDFDTNYEFKDRDVIVFGGTASEMHESFDWFWESPKTVPVQHLRDVAAELLTEEPGKLPEYEPSGRLQKVLADAVDTQRIRDSFIGPSFQVERLLYFSDRPRKLAFENPEPEHDITEILYGVVTQAEESVLIQSPYMVLSSRARKVFKALREEHSQIELVYSTNSLASTDADTVYGNTHRHKKRYVKKLGFEIYEFKPFPADAPDFFPRWPDLIREKKAGVRSKSSVSGDNSTMPMPAPRVGLHSKSFVVDGEVAMIGSHNFDPRSEGFNTENGIIVWDAAFARHLESLIRRDIEPQNSWVVAMKPAGLQAETALQAPPDVAGKFEPWPWSDTSVYELLPGKEPLSPHHRDFYRHYYPMGSFPEVVRTRRQYLVLFLGSFFFFLEPIL